MRGGDTMPTPARGHMPFEGHRSCAEWMGAGDRGNRGGEAAQARPPAEEAIARSHKDPR